MKHRGSIIIRNLYIFQKRNLESELTKICTMTSLYISFRKKSTQNFLKINSMLNSHQQRRNEFIKSSLILIDIVINISRNAACDHAIALKDT